MSWIICGKNKRGDAYSFECSSIKASMRTALADLNTLFQSKTGPEKLRERHTHNMRNGLYLLLKDKGDNDIRLAGFWVVFGHSYLEDGVKGAPDKDPPFANEILESLTEEVWWKNLAVWPLKWRVWSPIMVFEWPSDLSYRSGMTPPGLPMPESEYADGKDAELGDEFWLERYETEQLASTEEGKTSSPKATASDWMHLPANRSLMLVVKGKMKYNRASHKGWFHMVHPQYMGDESNRNPLPYPQWLDEIAGNQEYGKSDRDEHFQGQPCLMPDGHASFPISGWLTKDLGVWPMFPHEIRHAKLMHRDIGSKAIAQFKQAMSITLVVLFAIVCLSFIVKVATMPVFKDLQAPEVVTPQPALSLCSADHEKFMEEFRCQIRHYAKNISTDKPFCGDKGSNSSVLPLVKDFADLQPLYCGIRDRKLDNWVWGKEAYDFGRLAAAKACFNVLGHPYEYHSKEEFITEDGNKLVLPDPKSFYDGHLSINQLVNLVSDLDTACKESMVRMEMQLSGSIFSSLVGSKEAGQPGSKSYEGYQLRRMTANKALQGEKADLKTCFETGMTENPYRSEHFAQLCNGELREKESNVWTKLNRSNHKLAPEKTCNKGDSALQPNRDLNGCAVVSRYERARFGNDGTEKKDKKLLLFDKNSKPSSLWKCHLKLAHKDPAEKKTLKTIWDLELPVPANYNINGSGVRSQLQLDAGLAALGEGKIPELDEKYHCWKQVSSKLTRYDTVHPILDSSLEETWPSAEQQLCGQVCAAYYRFRKIPAEKQPVWVTPERDLQLCLHNKPPYSSVKNPKNRLDKLILPWNRDRNDQWVRAKNEHVCAFNMVAQSYFPESFLVGGVAPPVWAGSTTQVSKIAGGKKSYVYDAAENLSRYGRTKSKNSCGYAASQCFASLITEVMGNTANDPSEWETTLQRTIRDVKAMRPNELEKGDKSNPWCYLVQPYLGLDGELPEGQLDFPCAKGVDDSQKSAISAIKKLAKEFGTK